MADEPAAAGSDGQAPAIAVEVIWLRGDWPDAGPVRAPDRASGGAGRERRAPVSRVGASEPGGSHPVTAGAVPIAEAHALPQMRARRALPEAPGRPLASTAPLPVLDALRLTVPRDSLLDDVLAVVLSPLGRQAVESGRIGVAVFGRRRRPGERLRAGDRIELLGPVRADPQSERRARVRAQREALQTALGRDKWRTR